MLSGGGISPSLSAVWPCQSSISWSTFNQGKNIKKELTKSRIRHDNADMNSVSNTLINTCNPFDNDSPADLVNISSGKAANEETKKDLLGILE